VRPVRVLLVEDEPHLAEMVRVGLVSEGSSSRCVVMAMRGCGSARSVISM